MSTTKCSLIENTPKITTDYKIEDKFNPGHSIRVPADLVEIKAEEVCRLLMKEGL